MLFVEIKLIIIHTSRDGSVRSGPVLVLKDLVQLKGPDRTWSDKIKFYDKNARPD